MNYSIPEIRNQILATLQLEPGLSGVLVAPHAGEVSPQMFFEPEYFENMVKTLPFVLVRYSGRTVTGRTSVGDFFKHKLQFTLYVGARSVRDTGEAADNCLDYLAACYDALHGKRIASQRQWAPTVRVLAGDPVTQANFSDQSTLLCGEGTDERLQVNVPSITVYATTYTVEVLA